MDVLILYNFNDYDLFDVEKEKVIKGSIVKERISNNDLQFSNNLDFSINIERKGDKFFLKNSINTDILLQCDRCLENFNSHIETEFSFLFIYNKDAIEYIDDHILRIERMILGEIFLNIPFKKLCSNQCKGLCQICGVNLNFHKCNCKLESVVSPFEKLKLLIN